MELLVSEDAASSHVETAFSRMSKSGLGTGTFGGRRRKKVYGTVVQDEDHNTDCLFHDHDNPSMEQEKTIAAIDFLTAEQVTPNFDYSRATQSATCLFGNDDDDTQENESGTLEKHCLDDHGSANRDNHSYNSADATELDCCDPTLAPDEPVLDDNDDSDARSTAIHQGPTTIVRSNKSNVTSLDDDADCPYPNAPTTAAVLPASTTDSTLIIVEEGLVIKSKNDTATHNRNNNDSDPLISDVTPRRSKRSRKPIQSIYEAPDLSSKGTPLVNASKPAAPVTASAPDSNQQPDQESLIASIDGLYVHADKETVTVKDIVMALEAEYGIQIDKKTKLFLRNHLKNLVQGTVEPTVGGGDEHDNTEEAEDDEFENDSEEEPLEPEFNVESDEETSEVKESSKSTKRRARKGIIEDVPGQVPSHTRRERTSTRRATTKKPSAIRIHAERLRKKRMDELRVRQEELQLEQSKEEQERAEQIAARFDTNTEEVKLKRLEDRLDLLQKLDQRRIQVVLGTNNPMSTENEEKNVPPTTSTSDSDSDSDIELEIVDKVSNGPKVPVAAELPPSTAGHTREKALSILSRISKAHAKASVETTNKISWSDVPDKVQASPGKSLSARASLRRTLLSKQRMMGNLWLARELGYKSEQDHLRDCRQAEELKRNQVIKTEQERLKTNGRKQRRERMLISIEVAAENDEDDAEEEWKPSEDASSNIENKDDDEEDEEIVLAKQIDAENADHISETSERDNDKMLIDQGDDRIDDANQMSAGVAAGESIILKIEADAGLQGRGIKSTQRGISMETNCSSCTLTLQLAADRMDGAEQDKSTTDVETDMLHGRENDDEQSLADTVASQTDADNSVDATLPAIEAARESTERNKEFEKPKKAKNSAWQEMLRKEAEQLKKLKRRKGSGLVEAEAEEEEEEDVVAGLEDFGFSVAKKKNKDDDDEENDDELDAEDLENVVDDLSDDEGDEEAGERARKELMKREEKEKHKEMMRRIREGYDGRRGGIAGGGAGARGLHRFDQLVAADNREDAKRLGLLNDDELDSEDEGGDNTDSARDNGDVDDEVALLDKMLKDRFLHRSDGEMEEKFSDDDEDEQEGDGDKYGMGKDEDAEEREQERLAKRFAKRARMQRLLEVHGEDEEFLRLRLIDEDQRMKEELMTMKDVAGLTRRQVSVSSNSQSANSNSVGDSQIRNLFNSQSLFATTQNTGSFSLAVRACNPRKKKTSFLGGAAANKDKVSVIHKSVSLSHVVFHTENSQSRGPFATSVPTGKRKRALQTSSTLWDKVASNGFRQKKKH